jgi:hypothetical protein
VAPIQIGPTKGGQFAFVSRVPSHGFRRVALHRTSPLKGRVTTKGGEAVEFARCVATTEEGFVVELETDIEGKFNVAGIPDGPVSLLATSVDGRTGKVDVELPSEDVVVELPAR